VTKSAVAVLCFLPLAFLTACDGGVASTTTGIWSGYYASVTGARYTQVSASWVQPAVNCSGTPRSYSGFWVGLGAHLGPYVKGSTTEQTGTTAYCFDGSPFYNAWYELWPTPEVDYPMHVRPGDTISASVATDGNGHFTLTVADPREGWTRRTRAMLKPASLGSAEVIVENPPGYSDPFARFGAVRFTSATANGTSLSDVKDLQKINMVAHGKFQARTSPMSNGAFTVTWKHS